TEEHRLSMADKTSNKDSIVEKLKSPQWRMTFVLLLFLAFIFLWGRFLGSDEQIRYPVNYSQFTEQLDAGNIRSVIINGLNVTGEFDKNVPVQVPGEKKNLQVKFFLTFLPTFQGDQLLSKLQEKHVIINIAPQEKASLWGQIIIGFLPLALIIGFWIMVMRRTQQIQGGPGGLFSFGASKAKLYDANRPSITFKDVAGMDNVKQELQETIEFLKNPEKYKKLGAKIPKGVLLAGYPGTGKTLFARATAGEAGVPFYSISASEFIEMFVGVGASRVRDMFKKARETQPSIIFIDEIDAVGRTRGTGFGGGHDEREQTLNQLLSEMDGFQPHEEVIVMAATNRPDVLDPALLRPGRFDRHILIDRPGLKERRGILDVHVRGKLLAGDVDLESIARGTPGMTGADLENLTNEAALIAIRKNHDTITMSDFE